MRRRLVHHNPIAPKVGSRAGLTLIEILIAMALIGVSSLMFSYFSGIFRASRSSQIDTQALSIARSYLDTYRASIGAGAPPPAKPSLPNYTFSAEEEIKVEYKGKLMNITVTVQGPGGVARKFITQVALPR